MAADEIAVLAKRPPGPLGRWTLDEGTGTTSADTLGVAPALAFTGPASWGANENNGTAALSLNGTDANAGTGYTPVVRTDHSYTVMAWAKGAEKDGQCVPPTQTGTVLSQEGAHTSGFFLGLRQFTENGVTVFRWSASAPNTDASSGYTWKHATSIDTIDCSALDEWTHLAMVYDEVDHTLSLYVNGQLAQKTEGFTGWNATSGLRVGRAKSRDAFCDYWPGQIDDVQVYAGVLTDEQVSDAAAGQLITG